MTLTQIQYFMEAASCGSFQKASETLFISHQALNKQIKALEAEVGLPLFDRSGKKGLRLTQAGEILHSAWSKILPVHNAALSGISALKEEKKSHIIVGIQDIHQLRYGLLDLFQQYSPEYPGSTFEYRVGPPDQILSMLEHNQIDMAILLTLAIYDLDRYPHRILRTFDDRPVIAVSNRNPLSGQDSLSLSDLSGETFVMIDASHSKVVAQRQQRDFEAYGIYPKVVTVSNPKELELELAMNHGVSIVHKMHLTSILDKVTLFPFEPAPENETYSLVLLWNDPKFGDIADNLTMTAETIDKRMSQP